MKYFIVGDVHWSAYSSIVRSRGEKYSTRLENLIATVNWCEQEAVASGCSCIIYLGDFFDKSECNAEEITALQEVKWSGLKHFVLVGNHEMSRSNLELSSAHLFQLIPHCEVIDTPYILNTHDNVSLVFLPYILENMRTPLKEYMNAVELCDTKIVFSHNDISGIQLGQFVSTTGFSIEEIEENCTLFINGHLHNGAEIGKNIINVGNITGQNFSEDAFRYEHKAIILDTVEKTLVNVENPHAMNFYKVDLLHMQPSIDDKLIQSTLGVLKYPAVATIKINPDINFIVRDLLTTCNNIIECRLVTEGTTGIESVEIINNEVNIDHIQKFQSYVMENIGKDELTLNELERVSK